ncbi:aminoglycoside phosphotransferase family protein [Pseudonocardia sp. TRM90224]|uniref:aminoglycoside phosphotransferase family protein n=1 Tax=Pseudonocardia sp. TRM90224 TaxID=2812678 RepID=UPI001E4E015A|nr:aminoglycoside phosphotransferase family protein [Pseudonocardia sp. TRM90224]
MDPLPMPTNLVESVAEEESPERTEWLAQLSDIVRGVAARWSLTLGPPFQPGGQASWVAPVVDAAGRELVLKVGWRHYEAEHEVEGLRAWVGRGAVGAIATEVDGPTASMLLERALPGTPLAVLHDEPAQDEVVARMLRSLWHEPAPGHPFRPLSSLCDAWADEFDEEYEPGETAIDPGLAKAGIDLFRRLPREYAGPSQLLVTDLHAGNLLAHGEGWRLIDPKPYVGDPAYDALQHMLNCRERLEADPRGLARRMAGLLDLDAERVEQWLFARLVQGSVGMPWLVPVVPRIAPR